MSALIEESGLFWAAALYLKCFLKKTAGSTLGDENSMLRVQNCPICHAVACNAQSVLCTYLAVASTGLRQVTLHLQVQGRASARLALS